MHLRYQSNNSIYVRNLYTLGKQIKRFALVQKSYYTFSWSFAGYSSRRCSELEDASVICSSLRRGVVMVLKPYESYELLLTCELPRIHSRKYEKIGTAETHRMADVSSATLITSNAVRVHVSSSAISVCVIATVTRARESPKDLKRGIC